MAIFTSEVVDNFNMFIVGNEQFYEYELFTKFQDALILTFNYHPTMIRLSNSIIHGNRSLVNFNPSYTSKGITKAYGPKVRCEFGDMAFLVNDLSKNESRLLFIQFKSEENRIDAHKPTTELKQLDLYKNKPKFKIGKTGVERTMQGKLKSKSALSYIVLFKKNVGYDFIFAAASEFETPKKIGSTENSKFKLIINDKNKTLQRINTTKYQEYIYIDGMSNFFDNLFDLKIGEPIDLALAVKIVNCLNDSTTSTVSSEESELSKDDNLETYISAIKSVTSFFAIDILPQDRRNAPLYPQER